jgi:Flp pilus assembly pilin Flp
MIIIKSKKIRHLIKNESGASAIEFALAAPIFFMLMMGVFDVTYSMYMRSILNGVVEQAGRNASLEIVDPAVIDAQVEREIARINGQATIAFTRRTFENFIEIDIPEELVDANNNGLREPGECFIDRNSNGIWDTISGDDGLGGADDVVRYDATLTYRRLFPMWSLVGLEPNEVIVATTILRNQPFAADVTAEGDRICT